MSLSRIFTSQICLLTIFAKIKFSRIFPNSQYSDDNKLKLLLLKKILAKAMEFLYRKLDPPLSCLFFCVTNIFMLYKPVAVVNAASVPKRHTVLSLVNAGW